MAMGCGLLLSIPKLYSQSDTAHYLVMKVNDAILDCPHFQGLFKQMEAKNNWKEVERNYKERFLIISYPVQSDIDIIEKFKGELNNVHFPVGVITEIYTKNNFTEVKNSLNK